jgi:hypothetical protein
MHDKGGLYIALRTADRLIAEDLHRIDLQIKLIEGELARGRDVREATMLLAGLERHLGQLQAHRDSLIRQVVGPVSFWTSRVRRLLARLPTQFGR